jgi:hypothetical protein
MGEEAEKAFARIRNEEFPKEEEEEAEEGEVKVKKVYSVHMFRRSDKGPFFLGHQVRAVIKQVASRLGFFQKKKGTKGDLSEFGTAVAHGDSLQNPDRPWEIYPRMGKGPATTHFETVSGCVKTPNGKKSITSETEMVDEGAEYEVLFRYPRDCKLTDEDMIKILGGYEAVGQGSVLSKSYGRVQLVRGEIVG